jgi:hypothetical protein
LKGVISAYFTVLSLYSLRASEEKRGIPVSVTGNTTKSRILYFLNKGLKRYHYTELIIDDDHGDDDSNVHYFFTQIMKCNVLEMSASQHGMARYHYPHIMLYSSGKRL